MKEVKRHLAERQRDFVSHPFFARLERNDRFESEMAFAPDLTFWVFAFQDILRLNETRVTDPALRKIARHHRAEDRGHEAWFLDDLAELDPVPRDIPWLFGRQHQHTRDAAYALVSEVFRTNDDRVRIALVLTLESAGHIFFERVAAYVERHGASDRLRYFSSTHLAVEKEHALFEAELMKALDVDLPAAVQAESIAMIDRCYDAFHQLFSSLDARLERRASGTFSVAPGRLKARPATKREAGGDR
jgi:hypothetical protein